MATDRRLPSPEAFGEPKKRSSRPILGLRFAPRAIVEPTDAGGFAVTLRPILAHRDLERRFPAAGDALDYADMIADELGGTVVDRTGVA